MQLIDCTQRKNWIRQAAASLTIRAVDLVKWIGRRQLNADLSRDRLIVKQDEQENGGQAAERAGEDQSALQSNRAMASHRLFGLAKIVRVAPASPSLFRRPRERACAVRLETDLTESCDGVRQWRTLADAIPPRLAANDCLGHRKTVEILYKIHIHSVYVRLKISC